MNGPLLAAPLALVLAQETTAASDDTGRTVVLVIGALLALAVVLAGLTFWYWRHTDPRKRSMAVSAASRPATVAPPRVTVSPPQAAPARPPASAAASRAGGAPSTGTAADRGISADEWMRLTGSGQSGSSERS